MASCIFYMYFIPIYILILFVTIIVDYIAGIMIEDASGKKRKMFLVMSIVANIGVLAIFKYFNFFIANFNDLFLNTHINAAIPLLKIILPIGLSFHTFQAMSYTIEVYRGNQKAERHIGIYALYVMFYPQLVAGPIERPQNMLHQFYEAHHFNWDNFHSGLRKMLWGFFKKVAIADRLAMVVNTVYNQPHEHNGFEIIIATIFFAFQIYCDFSGYSDIALGAAEIMGFKLTTNFNKPYFSSSIAEFWKRWHISLSTWFRDYLYISLGGNRISINRTYLNMFIVFLVSGFWHGANWTFVVWGALHGLYLILGLLTGKKHNKESLHNKRSRDLKIFINFFLVTFAWIFFRASTINDAYYLISHLGSGWHPLSVTFYKTSIIHLGDGDLIYGMFNITIGTLLVILLLLAEKLSHTNNPIDALVKKPVILRWGLYYSILLIIILFGVYKNNEFIYFQF